MNELDRLFEHWQDHHNKETIDKSYELAQVSITGRNLEVVDLAKDIISLQTELQGIRRLRARVNELFREENLEIPRSVWHRFILTMGTEPQAVAELPQTTLQPIEEVIEETDVDETEIPEKDGIEQGYKRGEMSAKQRKLALDLLAINIDRTNYLFPEYKDLTKARLASLNLTEEELEKRSRAANISRNRHIIEKLLQRKWSLPDEESKDIADIKSYVGNQPEYQGVSLDILMLIMERKLTFDELRRGDLSAAAKRRIAMSVRSKARVLREAPERMQGIESRGVDVKVLSRAVNALYEQEKARRTTSANTKSEQYDEIEEEEKRENDDLTREQERLAYAIFTILRDPENPEQTTFLNSTADDIFLDFYKEKSFELKNLAPADIEKLKDYLFDVQIQLLEKLEDYWEHPEITPPVFMQKLIDFLRNQPEYYTCTLKDLDRVSLREVDITDLQTK